METSEKYLGIFTDNPCGGSQHLTYSRPRLVGKYMFSDPIEYAYLWMFTWPINSDSFSIMDSIISTENGRTASTRTATSINWSATSGPCLLQNRN